MQPTLDYLVKYFHRYNERYFDSILPLPKFSFTKGKRYLGFYYSEWRGISISLAWDAPDEFFQNTLIHEMIHYYLDYINDVDKIPHGPKFKREAARINKDGWNIQRCATEEEMAAAILLVHRNPAKPKGIFEKHPTYLITNPPTKEELVEYILNRSRKDKYIRLWLCYPVIQELIYEEYNELDFTEEWHIKQNKAIEKAIKLLIEFNRNNAYNLLVLHSDLAFYYYSIGKDGLAVEEDKFASLYINSKPTSFIQVAEKVVVPIKGHKDPIMC